MKLFRILPFLFVLGCLVSSLCAASKLNPAVRPLITFIAGAATMMIYDSRENPDP